VAYVNRLRAARIPCELEEFGDMIHAYLNLENLVPDACRDIYQQIGGYQARQRRSRRRAPVADLLAVGSDVHPGEDFLLIKVRQLLTTFDVINQASPLAQQLLEFGDSRFRILNLTRFCVIVGDGL